jgi:hypothetical protein
VGDTLGSLIHVTEPGDARATRMLVESAEKGIGELPVYAAFSY